MAKKLSENRPITNWRGAIVSGPDRETICDQLKVHGSLTFVCQITPMGKEKALNGTCVGLTPSGKSFRLQLIITPRKHTCWGEIWEFEGEIKRLQRLLVNRGSFDIGQPLDLNCTGLVALVERYYPEDRELGGREGLASGQVVCRLAPQTYEREGEAREISKRPRSILLMHGCPDGEEDRGSQYGNRPRPEYDD